MATLKQAIQFAQQNPKDPQSIELSKRLARGDFDKQAKSEGIDLSPIQPKKQGFIRGELTGGADISGFTGAKRFGAELFQSTLGSRGLLGVAQLPGKAIGARSAIEQQTILEQERGETFDMARALLKKIRETTDEEELQRLRRIADKFDGSLFDLNKAQRGLDRFAPTAKEALGTTISAAATVAPVGAFRGVSKVQKALTVGRESIRGAGFAAGGALAEDRIPTAGDVATGAAIGAAVPVVGGALGTVTRKVLGTSSNILKRLAGGLGVSFEDIATNPEVAQKTAQSFLTGEKTVQIVLKDTAQIFLKGVQTFRQKLRNDFGKAISSLSAEDISPSIFRKNLQGVFDKFGISVDKKTGERVFNNVEFFEQRNLNKASSLIEDLSTTKLDGLSLRRVMNRISEARFKIATTDERLSFNAFIKELETGVRTAISESTNKLGEINKVFSEGMQIVEVMEQEFGKVKFTNLKELNTFSKKLEGLLKKKGIAPEVIDDFLIRIGEDPTAIRATEAVRGAFASEPTAEAAGLTFFEVVRQITAGILTPQDITRISIQIARLSNTTEKVAKPVIEALAKLKPIERIAIIRAFVQSFQE